MSGRVNPKLAALIVLLVLALGYLVVLRPQGAALGAAREERQSIEQQVAQLERQRQPDEADAGQVDPRLARLDVAIPADAQLSTLFRQLSAIATETGMQQTSLTPSALGAEAGTPGGSLQVALAVTGPAGGADAYLGRLATLERLLVVEQVTLQRSPEGVGDVQLQLSARVFTSEVPAGADAG